MASWCARIYWTGLVRNTKIQPQVLNPLLQVVWQLAPGMLKLTEDRDQIAAVLYTVISSPAAASSNASRQRQVICSCHDLIYFPRKDTNNVSAVSPSSGLQDDCKVATRAAKSTETRRQRLLSWTDSVLGNWIELYPIKEELKQVRRRCTSTRQPRTQATRRRDERAAKQAFMWHCPVWRTRSTGRD